MTTTIRTTTDAAVVEEWAERLQCADLVTDYPLTDEDGYSGWLEQPETEQERYRGLARMAFAAGLRPVAGGDQCPTCGCPTACPEGALQAAAEQVASAHAEVKAARAEVKHQAAQCNELGYRARQAEADSEEARATLAALRAGIEGLTAPSRLAEIVAIVDEREGWSNILPKEARQIGMALSERLRALPTPASDTGPTMETETAHAAMCDADEGRCPPGCREADGHGHVGPYAVPWRTETPTPDLREHRIIGVGASAAMPAGYVVCACSGDDTGYGDGTPIPAGEYVSLHLTGARLAGREVEG